MRFAVLSVVVGAFACAGHPPIAAGPQPAAAPEATRWVAEHPSFVIASPAIADAQHDLRDVIDALSVVTGFGAAELSGIATGLAGVDVLDPDALAGIGVDVHASWTAFADASAGGFASGIDPTIVIHLAAPDKMVAFLERQRARGLTSTATTVDQVQISSAELVGGVSLQWAIAGDWMWLHVTGQHTPARTEPATQWFTNSHGPHGMAWGESWAWAARAAGGQASAVGFVDLHDVHDRIVQFFDKAQIAPACRALVPDFRRLSFALHGDPHQLGARIALDVGSTSELASHVLAPPSGWAATAATAALAVQSNLDASALVSYLSPCASAAGKADAFTELTGLGLRTARGLLVSFDPETAVGTGAINADLAQSDFLGHTLDRIPMRSTLESARTFAGHRGARIEIPFSFTVEYVLEPHLFVGAMGDGLVGQILAPAAAPSAPPPVFAVDLAPAKLPAKTWATLIQAIADHKLTGSPGPRAQRAAEHLVRWRAAHVAVSTEGNEVVLTATGER